MSCCFFFPNNIYRMYIRTFLSLSDGESLQSPSSSFPVKCSSNLQRKAFKNISCQLSFEDETLEKKNPCVRDKSSDAGEMEGPTTISPQLLVLNKLEFRKLFLVLSYIGRLVSLSLDKCIFRSLFIIFVSVG